MQINRMFEIIYILLNKKSQTAKELAEHFGVSTRTIYRDIDALSLAKIPVYTEKGKGGGIRLLPDFVLRNSLLSEEEQREILSALEGLSTVKAAQSSQVLQKLSALFNKPVENWLQVDFSDWTFASSGLWDDFKTAILERRIVEFDYYSTSGEKTRRRIEPIQLWFKLKAWYVTGFCETRQDVRLFKLSRVRNPRVTDRHFSDRSFPPFPSDSDSAAEQDKTIPLKLKIQPEMTWLVLDEFTEEEAEKQPDGSFIVSTAWPQSDWLYGFLLSFGEYLEVLEPLHLRDAIREKAEKIIKANA